MRTREKVIPVAAVLIIGGGFLARNCEGEILYWGVGAAVFLVLISPILNKWMHGIK